MGYEVKARTTTELLDGAFQLYRNHFAVFASISLTVYGVICAATLLANHVFTGHWAVAKAAHPSHEQLLAAYVSTPVALLGTFAVHFLLTVAVSIAFTDGALSSSAIYARAGGYLPRFLSVLGRYSVKTTLLCLLFIVPGIIAGLNWMLYAQVVVLEPQVAAPDVLPRAKTLILGMRGRIAGLLLVLGLLVAGLSAAAAAIAPAGYPLVSTVLTFLIEALLGPLSPCLLTLAYIDARVRKEGYDMEILAQQTAAPSA